MCQMHVVIHVYFHWRVIVFLINIILIYKRTTSVIDFVYVCRFKIMIIIVYKCVDPYDVHVLYIIISIGYLKKYDLLDTCMLSLISWLILIMCAMFPF